MFSLARDDGQMALVGSHTTVFRQIMKEFYNFLSLRVLSSGWELFVCVALGGGFVDWAGGGGGMNGKISLSRQ